MKVKEIKQEDMVEGKQYVAVWDYEGKNFTATVRVEEGVLQSYEYLGGCDYDWLDVEFESQTLAFLDVEW